MTKKSEKIWTGNVRDAALTILMAVEKQQAYSNLLLHQTIEKYTIDPKDRALLTELTYGTLQYKMTLDYYLQPFIKGKLDDWVKQLLRLSYIKFIIYRVFLIMLLSTKQWKSQKEEDIKELPLQLTEFYGLF